MKEEFKPDYDYWLKMEGWALEDAAQVLRGVCPFAVQRARPNSIWGVGEEGEREREKAEKDRAEMLIPLREAESCWGILNATNFEKQSFKGGDGRTYVYVGSILGVAVKKGLTEVPELVSWCAARKENKKLRKDIEDKSKELFDEVVNGAGPL